jgi:hypothetical protein
VTLQCLEPANPVQYGVNENVNGRRPDESLNELWFFSLDDAPRTSEAFHVEDNDSSRETVLHCQTTD